MHGSAARGVLYGLLASFALGACGRAPHDEARVARQEDSHCRSRAEGSRWAGTYRQAGTFGDSAGEEIAGLTLAGIAAADSMVYVMESARARLWLLRPDLSPIRSVGREGRGPGEWHPFGPATQGGSMGWVNAGPNGLRLYDGIRIQLFGLDGRFERLVGDQALATGISPMQSRHRYVGDTLLYSRGGYDPMATAATTDGPPRRADPVGGRSLWHVQAREGSRERTVLTLGLVPIEHGSGLGPQQARPLWDANGDCVAASDGAAPMLVYTALRGGSVDTARIPLPRAVAPADDRQRMEGVLPPGYRLPPPTTPVRIRDLAVDPDGYAWLLPVQPEGGVPGGFLVVRVDLGGGRAVQDTVPAFPRAFGAPGVFYAEARTADGALRVIRYAKQ